MLQIVHSLHIDEAQKQLLFELWNNEYPEKLSFSDISKLDDYLHSINNKQYYFAIENNKIVGWALIFERKDNKWFAIIVDKYEQRKGIGNQLLNYLKEIEYELYGWVIDHNNDVKLNKETYQSPIDFYLKNDFKIIENQRLELDKISAVKIKWKKQK